MGESSEERPRWREHLPVTRMFALLDGVVAIAMTILVLELRLPVGLTGQALSDALTNVAGKIIYFLLSVAVIGVFWHGQYTIIRYAPSIDGPLLWLNFAFLALVALIPFPTATLQNYGGEPVGPALYGSTIGLTALVELAMWRRVSRAGAPTAEPIPAYRRRLTSLQIVALAVVFLGSVPLAFVSPEAATLSWWVLLPVRILVFRFATRRR
jgi:TMEM175 potassium channel family protein